MMCVQESGSGHPDGLNRHLQRLLEEVRNCTHCWFRDVGQWHLKLAAALPRRTTVSPKQVKRWERALARLRMLPETVRQAATADDETYQLLMQLASHSEPSVRLPAAAALVTLGRLPPHRAVCELLDAQAALAEHRYAFGMRVPAQFRRPLVQRQAELWERLCGQLAELVYGPILRDLHRETECITGARADIIVDDGSVRHDDGLIAWADLMIEAKSGALPHDFPYLPLCHRLEIWHRGCGGQWIEQLGVVYRNAEQLAAMAEEHNAPELARDIGDLAAHGSHEQMYLQVLKGILEREPHLSDLL